MSFLKKLFGFGSADDQKEEEKREEPQENTKKEEHDKEHQGEGEKPKNVCEFC